MRVRPMVGREAGTMCVVSREDDRRLVFDPRWGRSYSESMGSQPAESSRPSFVFIQALYEKGNARAVERTTIETLFEGFSVFGAAGGASKASTRPVLEEHSGAVGVTMKDLHQRVDSHGTCTGNVVRLLDNWCLLFNPMDKTEYGHFHRNLFFRSLVASKRNQNFVFVKALVEFKGNAYAIKRTAKEILTTLLEIYFFERTTKEMFTALLGGFYFSGAAGGAIKAPHHACLARAPRSGLRNGERTAPVSRQASIHGPDLRGIG
ncbi:hypothetical protein MRX96_018591 [Rhipicephalus microplus]